MAADLHALLWKPSEHGEVPDLPVVTPAAGRDLVLLPLTEKVTALLGAGQGDQTVDGFYQLTGAIAGWARQRSHTGTVAYLHSEFFGGGGFQAAVAWRGGTIVWGPSFTATSPGEAEDHYTVPADVGDMAANALLRHLGVGRGPAHDEFTAAGLDRQRWTDDW
jgi:hypothetical protein